MQQRKISDPKRVEKFSNFIKTGTDDYVAARVLFLSSLPQQAAILASTAVEKCFKALLAAHGRETHGHLKKAHWSQAQQLDPEFIKALDGDFLKLNQKIYLTRYTDDLPPGFNAAVLSREFLAELDATVFSFHRLFKIESAAGKERKLPLIHLVDAGDQRVIAQNHVLEEVNKDEFIYREPQIVFEIRKVGHGNLLSATYEAVGRPKVQGFLRPAMVQDPANPLSFEMCCGYKPQESNETNRD